MFTDTTLLTLLSGLCSDRHSMSYLRPGRGGENRRSVFYTSNHSTEEWELIDAPPKDFPESKHPLDTHRRMSTQTDFKIFFAFSCFSPLFITMTTNLCFLAFLLTFSSLSHFYYFVLLMPVTYTEFKTIGVDHRNEVINSLLLCFRFLWISVYLWPCTEPITT